MSRYSGRRRIPPFHHVDLSMLPADETVFLNPTNQSRRVFGDDRHHHGLPRFYNCYGGVDGVMILDSWDQNQRFPHHYGVDETLAFDVSCEGLSEEAVVKHMKTRRHQASDEDGGVCVVCQDDLFGENGRIGRLECGHEYHALCIKKWLKIKNCCPICKAIGLSVVRV